jgi:hypothetical protein
MSDQTAYSKAGSDGLTFRANNGGFLSYVFLSRQYRRVFKYLSNFRANYFPPHSLASTQTSSTTNSTNSSKV